MLPGSREALVSNCGLAESTDDLRSGRVWLKCCMTDGVPLNLRLAPGEYRCVWLVPDDQGDVRRLDGDIMLSVESPPRGNAYGDVPLVWEHHDGQSSAGFPQVYSYPLLRGELRNGLNVVLLEAEVHSWDPGQALVNARIALVGTPGLIQNHPPVFDDMKLQITGLDSFYGVAPLKSFTFPTTGRDFYDRPTQVEANSDSEQSWSDENAEIHMSYDAALGIGDPFFYRMAFSPVVRIQLAQPIDFDDCVARWIEPLRRLVTVSTGRTEDLTFVSIGLRAEGGERRQHRLQVYGAGLGKPPFASRQNDVRRVKSSYSLIRDSLSPLALLRNWQELLDNHHPLLETYGTSIVIPRQHPRAQYLLLLQAFEGLHGYERKAEIAARTERHLSRRSEAIAALENCGGLPSSVRRFVKDFLGKRIPASLDEVLKDTLTSLPVDLTDLLGSSDLLLSVKDDPRAPQGVFGAVRIIRNDLAHGNKGYPTAELSHVSSILERVARAHMLRILGCSDEVQSRALSHDL